VFFFFPQNDLFLNLQEKKNFRKHNFSTTEYAE